MTIQELKDQYQNYLNMQRRLEELYAAKQYTIEARILDNSIHGFKMRLVEFMPVILENLK